MKKFLFLYILIAVFLLSGCSAARRLSLNLTDEHVANIETQMEIAKKLMVVWDFQSGFIRQLLGKRIEIPEFIEVKNALDKLDSLSKDSQDMKDRELGEGFGAYVQISYQLLMKALEKFAPGVLSAIVPLI